ncbi:shikimate/quinate 5-dehydrogenase family protein 2 [Cupriavidus sp. GA3-3]|uniref:shikimate dehydrogenase family protein n=1 Tax=Cupriavidus sp. GA3-3 TaxID=1229514 RepID=UPI00032F3424|nr:shikimate/quinate 5-dehydrogenase family protein 2 [Cupriavidus sp. GA3-3]EON18789.1 shikimate/quinate 5-dehydrogenase family protein 2 [Cupriavidus sp. GA3-3]
MHIDGNTQLIGIIAHPIAHVRTPQRINALVAEQGINAVCVPFHVEPERLQASLAGATVLRNLRGLVVTIPHKEAVLAACGALTETASLVGAVNAMRFDPVRQCWEGANFDGDGFVQGLRQQGHSLRGKRVLQIGAGGAGKAMAYAIAREQPVELVIHNRSAGRAAELAEGLRRALPSVTIRGGEADPGDFDVVVNATSLGLQDSDALPLAAEQLARGTLVCEAVVRDGDTALLKAARARGCLVHHGEHMLSGQILEIAAFLGIALKARWTSACPPQGKLPAAPDGSGANRRGQCAF